MAIFQLRTIDGSFFKGHFYFYFCVPLIVGPCRSLFLLWERCVASNASSSSITFTLAAAHHRLLSCIFCPSASPSPHLKPPGDANWTTQIFDGQRHKCATHSAHGMVTTCHWRFQRHRNAL